MKLLKSRFIIISLVILAAVGGIFFFKGDSASSAYRTEKVEMGPVIQKVSANGTLNPVTVVNVGTQVSGILSKLYVDFNSKVEKGQLLAELDQSLFLAQLGQSTANLRSAEAGLKLAQQNYKRELSLKKSNYTAQAELDKASQELQSAQAQVDVIKSLVQKDQTNLEYSKIQSPVSGVVVSRSVDVGQTVAASFQTPTLFKIAQDLKFMQIIASVSEADVGQIEEGQKVVFTVDAYRNREFEGIVKQVRLDPTTVQNVVTYNVVIDVDNKDETLLPGMTAFVNIMINQRDNALRVVNSAFQYKPAADRKKEKSEKATTASANTKTVYILDDSKPKAVAVQTGIATNQYTEIVGGELKEGDKVIVEEISEKKTQGPANRGGGNQMPRRLF